MKPIAESVQAHNCVTLVSYMYRACFIVLYYNQQCTINIVKVYITIICLCNLQGVPGGMCQISGECSLG